MAILLLIVGLVLFVGLVVIHEYGHFIMARRNGVDVEEFGIGFPPKAKGWKIKGKKTDKNKHLPASAHKGFEFTLNWLPLGGFVRLKGEHDSDTEPGTFGASTTWVKTKIMAAGVVMNLIAAFVLFTIVGWIGTPVLLCDQFNVASDTTRLHGNDYMTVATVERDSPAARIGLKQGDKLLAAGPSADELKRMRPSCDFSGLTQSRAGQALTVRYEQGGREFQKTAQLRTSQTVAKSIEDKRPVGYMGVSLQRETEIVRATWSAPVMAGGIMYDFTIATFQGLGKALAGVGSIVAGGVTGNNEARTNGQTAASEQVSGPLGIYAVLRLGAAEGIGFMLFIVAIISLSLAIMNVLPIPALDGGKLFITYLWRSFGKRVPEKVEDYIYGGSFLLLLMLMALISVVDVRRFF